MEFVRPTDGSIAAIVVTMDRPASLERTLRSLLTQTRPPDRIFVVNNGEPLKTTAVQLPLVRVVETNDNLGYAGGLARGVEAAASDQFDSYLFCDDDTTASLDLLERLTLVLDSDDQIGVVGTAGGLLWLGIPRHGRYHHSRKTGAGTIHYADFCLVDHALIRADALRRAKAPDPALFMMLEDVDFTDRVRRAGFDVCVLESSVDRKHLGSAAPWRLYYQTRNQALIARKRRSPLLFIGWAIRTTQLTLAAIVLSRDPRKVHARFKGAMDGLLGRTGRSLDPRDHRFR